MELSVPLTLTHLFAAYTVLSGAIVSSAGLATSSFVTAKYVSVPISVSFTNTLAPSVTSVGTVSVTVGASLSTLNDTVLISSPSAMSIAVTFNVCVPVVNALTSKSAEYSWSASYPSPVAPETSTGVPSPIWNLTLFIPFLSFAVIKNFACPKFGPPNFPSAKLLSLEAPDSALAFSAEAYFRSLTSGSSVSTIRRSADMAGVFVPSVRTGEIYWFPVIFDTNSEPLASFTLK